MKEKGRLQLKYDAVRHFTSIDGPDRPVQSEHERVHFWGAHVTIEPVTKLFLCHMTSKTIRMTELSPDSGIH